MIVTFIRKDEAVGSVEFQARFTLVAAANPCPCGCEGDHGRPPPVFRLLTSLPTTP